MDTAEYFRTLDEQVARQYEIAGAARKKGLDPSTEVEAQPTRNLAERVEGLVGPKYIADEIKKAQEEGLAREKIVERIIDWILKGTYLKGLDKQQKIEQALRTAMAILTEGVVSAPLEGISQVAIEKNPDGSDYLSVYFAGPIRGAGGTAAALSVLLADYIRRKEGVSDFRPTQTEIERYKEEISIYHKRIVRLQYMPSEEEIELILKNVPVCINGDPTERMEVDIHKGLERIKTDRVRGGICLVIGEGIAQKAKKIMKFAEEIKLDGWEWLKELKKGGGADDQAEVREIRPNKKFLEDIVAGRPIFAYPSRPGAFRLRYGRSNMCGIASKAIHPATMEILDEFPVTGTQMRIERPGKGMIAVPCAEMEGPVIKDKEGSVRIIKTVKEAKEAKPDLAEILSLGDILIPFGDFLNNNEILPPSGYVEEWWAQEYEKVAGKRPPKMDGAKAVKASKELGVPLHPKYTAPWHDITVAGLKSLTEWFGNSLLDFDYEGNKMLLKDENPGAKRALELLLIPHTVSDGKVIVEDYAIPLLASLGLLKEKGLEFKAAAKVLKGLEDDADAYGAVRRLSAVRIKKKVGCYIGARMGRPEKAKERKMVPAPHVLFPVGEAGTATRSVNKASKNAFVRTEVARMRCPKCKKLTFMSRCPDCQTLTELEYKCPSCGFLGKGSVCKKCKREMNAFELREVPIKALYEAANAKLKQKPSTTLKGVKGMTSSVKIPEPLDKGILRVNNDVFVFKDGTIRYDGTDIPTTHFRPKDIGTPVEELRKLGYGKDVEGEPLEKADQVVELMVQDVIVPTDSLPYLMGVCGFVDDLLEKFYGLERFYKVKKKSDITGKLVVGLAPHTSAAILGRIIGHADVKGILAHPYWHSAKRRNCFAGETRITYSEDDKIKTGELRDIAESFLRKGDVKQDDWGGQYVDVGNVAVLALDDGKLVKKKVKNFVKTPAPNHMIRFTTAANTSLTVSPDHNMLLYENGKIEKKKASEVEAGCHVPFRSKQGIGRVEITQREIMPCADAHIYSLEVEDVHNLALTNGIVTGQCDGDEDSIMLLMDVLLNFSYAYLPDKRGGKMDAPLVVNTNLDPNEIDDEAHCMETVFSYPLEFYEKTQKLPYAKELDIDVVENHLENDPYHMGLTKFSTWSGVPKTSKYVQLGEMSEKTDVELKLCKMIRAVDVADVARRLVDSHLIRDTYGNLRAFARQKFRCVKCNRKFRRAPLLGKCDKCGGRVILTVSRGTITKYVDLTDHVVKNYVESDYIKQRMIIVKKEIESVFENDKVKQFSLSDFA